jgi:hypothetical protein
MVVQAGAELGLDIEPIGVLTSSNRITRQLASFVNVSIKDISQRYPWSVTIGTNPFVIKSSGEYGFTCTSDDDIPLVDSDMVVMGARWRFLHSKGFTYDEEFRAYEKQINYYAFEHNRGMKVDTNAEPTSEA